jgi:hypothetical protein
MDGTAAVGVGTTWARADHVHPTDTSRYAANNPAAYINIAQARAGLTDGSNAPAGAIGEFLTVQTLSTATVPLVSNADVVIATLTLTAGDWEVHGSGGATMANNNSTTMRFWLNAGGTTNPPIDQIGGNAITPVPNNTPQIILPLSPLRVSSATPVNVALGATMTTSGGTLSGWGKIMARRMR